MMNVAFELATATAPAYAIAPCAFFCVTCGYLFNYHVVVSHFLPSLKH
jgi:hypothetical protein